MEDNQDSVKSMYGRFPTRNGYIIKIGRFWKSKMWSTRETALLSILHNRNEIGGIDYYLNLIRRKN